MVTPNENDDNWDVETLTTDHNGDNDAEVERVLQAHPGEPECVTDRRVLGALAPFRCTFQSHFSRYTLINLYYFFSSFLLL